MSRKTTKRDTLAEIGNQLDKLSITDDNGGSSSSSSAKPLKSGAAEPSSKLQRPQKSSSSVFADPNHTPRASSSHKRFPSPELQGRAEVAATPRRNDSKQSSSSTALQQQQREKVGTGSRLERTPTATTSRKQAPSSQQPKTQQIAIEDVLRHVSLCPPSLKYSDLARLRGIELARQGGRDREASVYLSASHGVYERQRGLYAYQSSMALLAKQAEKNASGSRMERSDNCGVALSTSSTATNGGNGELKAGKDNNTKTGVSNVNLAAGSKQTTLSVNVAAPHGTHTGEKPPLTSDSAYGPKIYDPQHKKSNLRWDSDYSSDDIPSWQRSLQKMPRDWTVVQVTCVPSKDFCFGKRGPNGEFIVPDNVPGAMICRWECGGGADIEPQICEIGEPRSGDRGAVFDVLKEVRSLIDENHKINILVPGRSKTEYWRARDQTSDGMRNLGRSLEDRWLRQWRCLFQGQLLDAALRDRIATFASQLCNRSLSVTSSSDTLSSSDRPKTLYRMTKLLGLLLEAVNYLTVDNIMACLGTEKPFQLLSRDKAVRLKMRKDIKEFVASLDLKSTKRGPIILILDKPLQPIPWETIPILESHPVSRMSSMHMLATIYDGHYALKESLVIKGEAAVDTGGKGDGKSGGIGGGSGCSGGGTSKIGSGVGNKSSSISIGGGVSGVGSVNSSTSGSCQGAARCTPLSCFCVLNPDGSLVGVQDRMLKYIESDWKEGGVRWGHVSGVAPKEDECLNAIINKQVYLYCGHGSGSRYLPGEWIQRLDCRAVPLLMGCSSAQLRDQGGRLDSHGIVQSYLLACAPAIVGMLWEVTDVECDKVTLALLDLWLPKRRGVAGAAADDKEEREPKGKVSQQKSLQNRQPATSGSSKESVKAQKKSPVENDYVAKEPELLRAVVEARKAATQHMTAAAMVVYGLPISSI